MELLKFDENPNESISKIYELVKDTKTSYGGKERNNGYFYNIPCSFDIETSSFLDGGLKRGICYVWQFGVGGGLVVLGRTLKSFLACLNCVKMVLGITLNNRMVIYVHNLAFEFQFIKDYFEWDDVFATDRRKPLRATTTSGFEFRCSYLLSNASLEQVAKNLTHHNIKKLVGNLDYKQVRTPNTQLTKKEIDYAINDVLIVNAYIAEELETYKTLNKIPMTSTGKVRNYIKDKCNHNMRFYKFMKKNRLSYKEYKMAKMAYMGGHTHSCAVNAFKTWRDVDSFDFSSSYPSVLVAESYPYGYGYEIPKEKLSDIQNIEFLMHNYCALVDVTFTDVVNTFYYDSIIPRHKCVEIENPMLDNGKVSTADSLRIVITDVDYFTFKKFYSFNIQFNCVILFHKTLLPKELIEIILNLYADKTTLKLVKGMEQEYARKKAMLNAIYGMFVTDIHRIQHSFIDGEWVENENDVMEELRNYNNSKHRTISYLYGVWCSAYARRNLHNGLYNIGRTGDVLYMDTDSLKIVNKEKHMDYINAYNIQVTKQLEKTCDRYKIDKSLLRPKDKKGIEHPLGVWDYEGRKGFEHSYDAFKTIGAKRYIYLDDSGLHITIAGVNKKQGAKYLTDKFGKYGSFVAFDDGLEFPTDATGKLTHTYIDGEQIGVVRDYLGGEYHYHEQSGIYLENSSYIMSDLSNFINYIRGLRSHRL